MDEKWTLIIHVEDTGMDSGCFHDIIQTCTNHGKVIKAVLTIDGHENDLMSIVKDIKPQEGKC